MNSINIYTQLENDSLICLISAGWLTIENIIS